MGFFLSEREFNFSFIKNIYKEFRGLEEIDIFSLKYFEFVRIVFSGFFAP